MQSRACRRPVKPSQRLVDVVEQPTLLAREQKGLFAFHRVGPLIRHVEAVSRQIVVRSLQSARKRLVVLAKFPGGARPGLQQSLLDVISLFRIHGSQACFELARPPTSAIPMWASCSSIITADVLTSSVVSASGFGPVRTSTARVSRAM